MTYIHLFIKYLDTVVHDKIMTGYEIYRHPIEDDTLALVRYCHHKGFLLLPSVTYERNVALSEDMLPAIFDHGTDRWYYGIGEVAQFYAILTGITNILERARAFSKRHPDYHLHDHDPGHPV
jgi:hypothetical protein